MSDKTHQMNRIEQGAGPFLASAVFLTIGGMAHVATPPPQQPPEVNE